MNRAFHIAAVLAGCVVNAGFLCAQKGMMPVTPGMLSVSVEQKSDAGFDQNELLASVCENLAPGLTRDSGVFGLGVFSTIDCDSKDMPVGETVFRMKLEAAAKSATLSVSMVTPQKPVLPVAEIRFNHEGRLEKMLDDDAFSALLALALLDQMPMQIRFDGNVRVKHHKVTAGERDLLAGGVQIPESFFAFSTAMDDKGLMYPSSLGRIVLKSPKGKKSAYLHESGGGNSILVWRLETKMKKLPSSIFGLASSGRSPVGGGLQAKVDARAVQLIEEINENVLSKGAKAIGAAFGGGYIGLRYGPALLEGDLIGESIYFGALVEFRSGWLDGVRIYYDTLPEVTGEIDGQEGSFGGKRTILAYSLALKFDSWIRTIDLTPKVGLWSFKAQIPVESEPGVYTLQVFEVKKSPSFDIEIGAESASSFHVLRGWASMAASFLSTGKGEAKITSNRVGGDLLLSPWGATSPVTVSLLAFAFYEDVLLSRIKQDDSEEGKLKELTYQQAYAGGGLAISW
jgi:hypothetical protein